MASDGSVVLSIEGDNTNVKQALESTTKAVQKESQKWDKTTDETFKGMFKNAASAIGVNLKAQLITVIGDIVSELIDGSLDLASSLEQVGVKINNTFGGAGGAKIERWAAKAAAQFGLTELEAKNFTVQMGSMLQSMGVSGNELTDMSTSLVGLAADFAKLNGISMDKAFEQLKNGLSGNDKKMKEWGVDLGDAAMQAYAAEKGFEGVFDELSDGEKAMLRYQKILEQTANVQGFYAKNSDTFANSQQRIQTGFEALKAQIGEAILPIAKALTDSVGDLLDILTFDPSNTFVGGMEQDIADAEKRSAEAMGILGYMDQLYQKYGDAAQKSEEWAVALGHLKEVMPEVNEFIEEESGRLTISNEQLRQYIENQRLAAIEDAKRSALTGAAKAYEENQTAIGQAQASRGVALSEASAARAAIVDYINSHKQPGEKQFTDTGFLTIDQLAIAAKDVAKEFGESETTINALTESYKTHKAEAAAYADQIKTLQADSEALAVELEIAKKAVGDVGTEANAAASALKHVSLTVGGIGYVKGYANGLEYVPRDNFLALLHRGERVQTAAEADLTRRYGLQPPGMDYGTLGAAMWANAPSMGGNVYLDGRTVGQVISKGQANSYRAMQRSGFQA